MSFIQRELEKTRSALREAVTSDQYSRLYAVQQALEWALDPGGYASPVDVVTSEAGRPLAESSLPLNRSFTEGIPAGTVGYPADLHQPPSLGICGPSG